MIKFESNDFGNSAMRDSDLALRKYEKSSTELFDGQEEPKERFFHFDLTPVDEVDIENGWYDIVIVEGWKPEQVIDQDQAQAWDGEGELLAEISVDPITDPLAPEYPERPATPEYSEDCANLSWLLNFKIDELINSYCEDPPSGKLVGGGGGSKSPKRPQETIPNNPSTIPDKKPPYTYTELIELALREKGQLTVSGIYNWISERFPFFKPSDDRWKNSVRHNLSINPHFRKGAKAARGAGHLWTIAASSAALDRVLANCEARRLQASRSLEQEVAAAAASILQHHSTEFLNPVSAEQVAAECGLLDADFY